MNCRNHARFEVNEEKMEDVKAKRKVGFSLINIKGNGRHGWSCLTFSALGVRKIVNY